MRTLYFQQQGVSHFVIEFWNTGATELKKFTAEADLAWQGQSSGKNTIIYIFVKHGSGYEHIPSPTDNTTGSIILFAQNL